MIDLKLIKSIVDDFEKELTNIRRYLADENIPIEDRWGNVYYYSTIS